MGVPARGPVRAAAASVALVVLAALAVTAGCGHTDRLPRPQRLSASPPAGAATGSPSGNPDDRSASCDPDTDQGCYPTDTALPTGYGSTDYGTDGYGSDPYGGTATCPSTAPADTAITSEANRLSGGKLPSGVTVTDKQCAGSYLVADLTAPNLGTIQLVMRQDGSRWTGIAVGSYLCGSSALANAADARTLLSC
jgi:hypothetical protein